MQTAAIIGTCSPPLAKPVASIVTICTNQKRIKPAPGDTPAVLTAAVQSELAVQWMTLARSLPSKALAVDLYAGRAFGLARDAAKTAGAPLFIVSAGLGLVMAATPLPAYGLTVSRNGAESIWSKVIGPFDAAGWFDALLQSPYSVGWERVFSPESGRVLIALTKPYAEMVAPALAALPSDAFDRLRLFGAGISSLLPPRLREAVVPYDDRLDTLIPGTRSDFAQRALLHFVEHIATDVCDRKSDDEAVRSALAPVSAPDRPARRSASDADILILIKGRLRPGASPSRLLRQLRDDDQIACEQGRFAALFRKAESEKGAS